MSNIKYIKGDATNPQGEGKHIIVHICNDKNRWGAGFVLALNKKWSEPERMYRELDETKRQLGYVQYVQVDSNIIVVNMIGQHDIKPNSMGVPPIRYSAVKECLQQVDKTAVELFDNATIHMPRIGCGLAGGNWEIMEAVIKSSIKKSQVIVYDFK